MPLRCEIVTMVKVDSNDLERFIQETYGRLYEITAEEEWSNDTAHNYTVRMGALSEYEQIKLNNFKEGRNEGCRFMTRIFLKDLANKGLISEGEYTIEVSW